jgi:hypothetical protein
MTMISFSDQLFHDLMREHGPALQAAGLTAPGRRRHLRRGAWLASGAGALAVGITASLAAFGGTSPAYAITPHPDGTVTVTLTNLSGVTGANATLHKLGARVVVVPVRPGCPAIDSLPLPVDPPGLARGAIWVNSVAIGGSADGTIIVQAEGIPARDLLVVAVEATSQSTTLSAQLTTAPAPACVTMPAGIPAPGTGRHVSGSAPSGAPAPGGTVVQTTGPGSAPPTSTNAG